DEESFIQITNWEKHQNVDGMERARKLNAERNKRYRERKKEQKLLEEKDNNVSVTSRDGTEEEVEEEKEEDNRSTTTNNAIKFYEKNFGVASPYEQESILKWTSDSGEDLVIE